MINMYKLTKGKGRMANLTLENTDTNTSLSLGTVTVEIIHLLTTIDKFSFDDSSALYNAWDLTLSKELASALNKTAMKMSKPVRRKNEKTETAPEVNDSELIDAFALIFG